MAKWWRENRPDAEDLFDHELADVKEKLAGEPNPGTRYATVLGVVVYRVLLPKTQQHVYFSTDEQSDTRIVHSVWGARRGRGPRL